MALDSKVIYLRKKDGTSIKAYVVDYLLDTDTDMKYVIISNASGKSIKGFELVEGDAFILSAEEGKLISNYRNDDTFRTLTDIYEDGLSFNLKKRNKEILPEKEDKIVIKEETSTIVQTPKGVKEEQHIEPVKLENIEPAEKKEESTQESVQAMPIVYQGTIGNDEIGKEITFYVYDQTIVKKYKGQITTVGQGEVSISDLKTIEKINVALDFDVNQFIGSEKFEAGACFVDYDDYMPTVKIENGKTTVGAKISNFLRKPLEKRIEKQEENILSENKMIVFNGKTDVYNGKEHYSIWGTICKIVSENPLIVIPEKNGIKTIVYEDPKATSIEMACQSYQNLHPTIPVCLLKEKNLTDSQEYVLADEDYVAFKVQSTTQSESLLDQGKRILTEDEMIAKREAELASLRENTESKKKQQIRK